MNEQYITLVGKVCTPRHEEVYTPEVKSKLPIEASSEGRNLKDYTIYGNNDIGKNMISVIDTVVQSPVTITRIDKLTGSIEAATPSGQTYRQIYWYPEFEEGQTYILSCYVNEINEHARICFRRKSNYNIVNSASFTSTGLKSIQITYTSESYPGGIYISLLLNDSAATEGEINISELMLRKSGASEVFEPHQIGVGENTEVKSDLPIEFRSNGDDLLNYRIFGTVEGAGEITKNLLDLNKDTPPSGISDIVINEATGALSFTGRGAYIGVPFYATDLGVEMYGKTYTVSCVNNLASTTSGKLAVRKSTTNLIVKSVSFSTTGNKSITFTPDRETYPNGWYIAVMATDSTSTTGYIDISQLMLREVDTTPDFIPYGYQVPLTNTNGTETKTTDVYIGDSKLDEAEYVDSATGKIYRWADITGLSEPLCGISTYIDSLDLSAGTLTRRIKKLVLTGEEDWTKSNTYKGNFYAPIIVNGFSATYPAYCTHVKFVNNITSFQKDTMLFDGRYVYNCNLWFAQFDEYTTIDDFKSYLAAQYAAGTPVTVWYVLANPETSTIPVPSGLTGAVYGYLIQDGIPTPETPIYPTANGVKQSDGTYSIEAAYLQPTNPPLPLPAIETFKGTNTLDSTIEVGETMITQGYRIPLQIKQGATTKTADIYIGSAPLTQGQTITKSQSNVDLELFSGNNIIDTDLPNKPEMYIK